MTLRFAGIKPKKGKETVYSLVCETCQDPECARLKISPTDGLPLIILFGANKISNRKKIVELAKRHEGQFGREGRKHKLVAQGRRLSEAIKSIAFTEEWSGLTVSPEELAPGHPDYQKQQEARANLCPVRK